MFHPNRETGGEDPHKNLKYYHQSIQSNRKECIKRVHKKRVMKSRLFQKPKGAEKSHYSKQEDSTKAKVSETKIIQKEGSSVNRDPTMDLEVATREKLPNCWSIPPNRNRCRRYSSSGSQCSTSFSSHSFMSFHLTNAFTCRINKSRRGIMFCT